MDEDKLESIGPIYPEDWYFSEDLGKGIISTGVRPFHHPEYESWPEEKLNDYNVFKRLLLSIRDLSHARSAASFLREEVEWEDKYPLGELRRFQTYETSLIIAYCRPFSKSEGQVPQLSYKSLGIKLSKSARWVHDDLITKRNKLFAHSDADIVEHSNLSAYKGTRRDGSSFTVLHPPHFREGTYLDLNGVYQVEALVSSLLDAVLAKLQAMHIHFLDQIKIHSSKF